MRARYYFWIPLVLIVGTSCASYEEQRRIQVSLGESIDRFHERLNNEQFHEIYSQGTDTLQRRVDETEFTSRLKHAHEQLGVISGKATVLLTGREMNSLHWQKLFGREQKYRHVEMPQSELIAATETFGWTFENGNPRLDSYEFRFICRQPCIVALGTP